MNDHPDNTPDDDDEEQPHAHAFVVPIFAGHGPFGMSREEHEAMVDRTRAQMQSAGHMAIQFFDSLSEEQLTTFRGLLNAFSEDPHGSLSYYMGLTSTYLKFKYGFCPVCGKKHEQELHEMIDQEQRRDAELPPEQHVTDEAELLQNAEIYGVEFMLVDDGRPMHLIPVFCKNQCGAQWPNLADRMLRKAGPDGCPGCQQKAKFG